MAMFGEGEDTTRVVVPIGSMPLPGTTNTASFDIGAAHSKKEIFIVVGTDKAGGGRTLVAASTVVDGISVTKASTEFEPADQGCFCAFVSTPTSSGSVSITVAFNASMDSGRAYIFAVYNRIGIGGNQSDSDTASTVSGTTLTLNTTTIPANGIWFGVLSKSAGTTPSAPGTVAYNDSVRSICYRDFSAGSTPSDTFTWTTNAAAAATSWSFA